MSKSDYHENAYLDLVFNATAFPNVADNAATSPLTDLYLSLHTADPGDDGSQTTNECAYTSYARVAVARTSGGFTVSGSSVTLTAAMSFPEATGGTETATHFAIGTAVSGAGNLLYSGAVSPTVDIVTGVTPQLTVGTTITED